MDARRPTTQPRFNPLQVTRAPPRYLPNLALVVAVLGVSTSGLFIRLAESPPLVIATYRMVLVTALLLPVLILTRRSQSAAIEPPELVRLALAGLFLAAHFGLWTTSLAYTSVASSVVLVSTHPVFVALAEAVWLGRAIPFGGAIGIGLTVVGGLAIGFNELAQGGTSFVGCVLALGGALSMVGYLIIGRNLRAHLGLLSYVTAVYAVCGVGLLIATLLTGASLAAPSSDIAIFLALALLPTICGHTVFNWTLRHRPASVVATAFLGEPVGASLLAWWFLGEVPGLATILGGAMILFGLFLTMRSA
jgi:drug/metabolite transporter (DMT)-like permease